MSDAKQPPSFRIGGKMDPGRFVSQHQQHFLILGFHDDERNDKIITEEEDNLATPGHHLATPGHTWQQLVTSNGKETGDNINIGAPLSHPLRLNFGRNTLSPVREHQDGSNDLVALMAQRVNSVDIPG